MPSRFNEVLTEWHSHLLQLVTEIEAEILVSVMPRKILLIQVEPLIEHLGELGKRELCVIRQTQGTDTTSISPRMVEVVTLGLSSLNFLYESLEILKAKGV